MGSKLNGRNATVGGALAVLAGLLVLAVLLAGCAGGQTDSAEPRDESEPSPESSTDQEPTRTEEPGSGGTTTQQDGADDSGGGSGAGVEGESVTAEGGSVVAGESDTAGSGGSSDAAVLEMKGTEGTAFSGTCTFGDDEQDISGQVPARFDLQLGGRRLDCEILKQGEGKLRMELVSGGNRNVFQTTSPDVTVNLVQTRAGGSYFSTSSTVSR